MLIGSKLKKRRYKKGKVIRNPKIYHKTPRIYEPREINYKKYIIFSLIIILLGGLFYLIFMSGYFVEKDVILTNNKTITKDNFLQEINPILHKNILSNNLLFFTSQGLASEIAAKMPEIKSARVKKKWPDKLEIEILEREPILIWQTGSDRYLVDQDGIAYSKDITNVSLPLVVDESKKPVGMNKKFLTEKFIYFTKFLKELFTPRTGLNIESINLQESTLEASVKTKEGFTILFDTTRYPEVQIENLNRILADIKNKGENVADVEYIDLRLKEKIYYKIK